MSMIQIKYNGEIKETTLEDYQKYLINTIYKLLPLKEECGEWKSLLSSIIEEMVGANEVLLNNINYLSVVNRLEGLYAVEDFHLYRKTILGCLNTISTLYTHY